MGKVGKEEYKVPNNEELKQENEKSRLIDTHLRIEQSNHEKAKKYAKILKRSKSDVMNEMMRIGTLAFEIKYNLQLKIAPVVETCSNKNKDLAKQLNEKYNLITEKNKAESAKKSNDLRKEHEKRIIHDYTNEQDWTREGY